MRYILLIIIFAASSMAVISQSLRDWYVNLDGTRNMYVIDTISMSPTILLDRKNGNYFALAEDALPCRMDWNNVMDNPDIYILDIEFLLSTYFIMPWYENLELLNKWPDSEYYEYPEQMSDSVFEYSKNFDVVKFKRQPRLYILLLIQGRLYNRLIPNNCLDCNQKPIKFESPSAFYRLLIPVW